MSGLYGIVAEYSDPQALLRAAAAARQAGYRRMDAYTPFPVEGLAEEVGVRHTGIPLLTLLGGLAGGVIGLGMQVYSAAVDYPLNVGGRPLLSWASFVPITFELTILGACLSAIFGMLALNGLPRPHHPIFNTPFYEKRSASRFYLCITARDERFEPEATRRFFKQQQAEEIWEIEDA